MKIKINKLLEGKDITYSLPEVNVYPQNRWGNIARKQGLTTARNWRRVKEGTTKGINDFYNHPLTLGALTLLPLPAEIDMATDALKGTGIPKAAGKALNKMKLIFKSSVNPSKELKINIDPVLDKINEEIDKLLANRKTDPFKRELPISENIKTDDIKVLNSKPSQYLDFGEVNTIPEIGNPVPKYMQDVLDFYEKDVSPREVRFPYTDEINNTLHPNLYSLIPRGYKTFNKPIYVRKYLNDAPFEGYANTKQIVLKKDIKLPIDDTLVHEGTHLDQYNRYPDKLDFAIQHYITKKAPKIYSTKQTNLLNNIFDFGDEFKEKYKNADNILEGGASIRESRYALSKKYNKFNKDLDKEIDAMSTDDVLYHFKPSNGYTSNVYNNAIYNKNISKDTYAKWIKEAWKTIPGLTPLILKNKNINNENKY